MERLTPWLPSPSFFLLVLFYSFFPPAAEEDRNAMERLTLASLEHLPTAVLFVTDLTAQCGTSVADQWAIRWVEGEQGAASRPQVGAVGWAIRWVQCGMRQVGTVGWAMRWGQRAIRKGAVEHQKGLWPVGHHERVQREQGIAGRCAGDCSKPLTTTGAGAAGRNCGSGSPASPGWMSSPRQTCCRRSWTRQRSSGRQQRQWQLRHHRQQQRRQQSSGQQQQRQQ